MRVLFVTEDLANGGSERVISVLANGVAEENEAAVAAIRWDKVIYHLDEKVRYYPFQDATKGKIKRTIGRFLFLLHAIKDYKPDVVVAFDVVPIIYSLFCCKLKRQKLVVSERNDPQMYEGKGIISKIYYKAFDEANGAVFQTPDAQKYYKTHVQTKSTIIPNPINNDFVIPRFEGERNPEIVTACRLSPQKNLKLFIDIVAEIVKKYPEYRGVIYGDGPEKDNLIRYIHEKGMDDYIALAGKVNDIKDKIYKSKFYLCTSDHEGISNSMLEAMCLGLNVISTDCPVGGARMAITSGIDGILFPVKDKEAGVNAILTLIDSNSQSEKIGIAATKISDRWSRNSIVGKWIDYLQLVRTR